MKKTIPFFTIINFTVILVFKANTLSAQEVNPDLLKSKMYSNVIYGNIGVNLETMGDAWFTGTAYYERMFNKNTSERNISTFVNIGIGAMTYREGSSSYILARYGILTGAKNNHLEASLGVTSLLNESYKIFPISTSIGYRRQKPGGHFIFRTGVAWPEALYVGIGASF